MKTNPKNLHTYVPERVEPKTIGIIGGKGAMGQLLAREFDKDGYRVLMTGEDPSVYLTGRPLKALNRKLVKDSDVIVFAVPIHIIRRGVTDILGHGAPRGLRLKLFMDVTSTKVEPVSQMAKIDGPTIIGTHPMFGPSITSFKGQHVFITPITKNSSVLNERLDKWMKWVDDFWKARGAHTHVVTPEEHDQFVPHIQFAVLAAVILYGDVLRRARSDLSKMQRIYTPNSRMLSGLLGRMIRETNVELYANLITDNPHNRDIAQHYVDAAAHLLQLARRADRVNIAEHLKSISAYQPMDFKEKHFEMTKFINDVLVNRERVEAFLKSPT